MKKIFLLFLFFCLISFPVLAEEEITNYDVTLTVRPDASVFVTERITVKSEGETIKRGIYRDLLRRKGVKYHDISVKRNDQPEQFSVQHKKKYVRIYTGKYEVLLPQGFHTYEISYVADNIIQGFYIYDELSWYVTGNEWDFPIERVSARVILPDGANIKDAASYQGEQKYSEFAGYNTSTGEFHATRPLKKNEGLTIIVGFDKGFVSVPPVPFYKLPFKSSLYFSIGILLAYMFVSWLLFGRDPAKETIVPRFDTPANLTPAQACWIYSYGRANDECILAALLQGCLSGYLKITEKGKNIFHLSCLRKSQNEEEAKLCITKQTFEKKYSISSDILYTFFYEFMVKKMNKRYFTTNLPCLILAGILLFVLSMYMCKTSGISGKHTFYSAFTFSALLPLISTQQSLIVAGRIRRRILIPFAILFGFYLFAYFSSCDLYSLHSPQVILVHFGFVGSLAITVYSYLIIRPKPEAMQVIAHIDGIKMFLKEKESDMSSLVASDKIEKLLPYAVFLGLGDEWEEKMGIHHDGSIYAPKWYSNQAFKCRSFASNFLSTFLASRTNKIEWKWRPRRGGFFGGGFGGGGH
ncbi:MAG: DUF2207 domain-containing protein [Alphaproteobacteria bacterium]|nr:DUF2207 domain-containing protein [Alphaproteobacteria bacterium]